MFARDRCLVSVQFEPKLNSDLAQTQGSTTQVEFLVFLTGNIVVLIGITDTAVIEKGRNILCTY